MKKFDAQILEDQNIPSVILLGVVLNKLGSDAIDWDPITIDSEVKEEFNVSLTHLQFNKLMAAIDVLHNDNFESKWFVFDKICKTFSNLYVDYETLDDSQLEYIVLGVLEAGLIRGETIEFTDEVKAYMGRIFRDFGFVNAPTLFPFAIMPHSEDKLDEDSDKEKNEAVQQIVDVRLQEIREAMSSLS